MNLPATRVTPDVPARTGGVGLLSGDRIEPAQSITLAPTGVAVIREDGQ